VIEVGGRIEVHRQLRSSRVSPNPTAAIHFVHRRPIIVNEIVGRGIDGRTDSLPECIIDVAGRIVSAHRDHPVLSIVGVGIAKAIVGYVSCSIVDYATAGDLIVVVEDVGRIAVLLPAIAVAVIRITVRLLAAVLVGAGYAIEIVIGITPVAVEGVVPRQNIAIARIADGETVNGAIVSEVIRARLS
jgi:hypothetical protein